MGRSIRPLALCVFRDGERILLMEATDDVKRQTFYRPLGGGIEFGEHSSDALRREIREELGAEVGELELLGTIENRFTYNGNPGHEIIVVYDARFTDKSLYEKQILEAKEDDGAPFKAVWKRLDEFRSPTSPPMYPDGLMDLLTAHNSRAAT